MLWALWPRWLTGKELSLVGAVLLQKRQKREPQWRRWWVKYPISPGGGVWTGGVLGAQGPLETGASPGNAF